MIRNISPPRLIISLYNLDDFDDWLTPERMSSESQEMGLIIDDMMVIQGINNYNIVTKFNQGKS